MNHLMNMPNIKEILMSKKGKRQREMMRKVKELPVQITRSISVSDFAHAFNTTTAKG